MQKVIRMSADVEDGRSAHVFTRYSAIAPTVTTWHLVKWFMYSVLAVFVVGSIAYIIGYLAGLWSN